MMLSDLKKRNLKMCENEFRRKFNLLCDNFGEKALEFPHINISCPIRVKFLTAKLNGCVLNFTASENL